MHFERERHALLKSSVSVCRYKCRWNSKFCNLLTLLQGIWFISPDSSFFRQLFYCLYINYLPLGATECLATVKAFSRLFENCRTVKQFTLDLFWQYTHR